MLGKDYFRWANAPYLAPTSLSISYANNERIMLSEAGTEVGVITRLQKQIISAVWQCSYSVKNDILEKCTVPKTLIQIGTSPAFYARARVQSCDLVENSEFCDRTDGLYIVRVTFTEV